MDSNESEPEDQTSNSDGEVDKDGISYRMLRMVEGDTFADVERKLYELSDDRKRKNFLDDLFFYMQKRGTPINRLPIMAKQVLDLYELYNLVIARGGLVEVINKKLWQEIIKGLKLPSSITSAAFTLRTQYMKYLYPYECEKQKISSPSELQAAIDGNRREGRRTNYVNYGEMSPRANYSGPGLVACASPPRMIPSRVLHNGKPSSAYGKAGLEEEIMSRIIGSYSRFPPPQKEALNLSDSSRSSEASKKEDAHSPKSKKMMTMEDVSRSFLSSNMPSAHIKITNRGERSIGADSSLVMCMEINGMMYQGVLFAQSHVPDSRSRFS